MRIHSFEHVPFEGLAHIETWAMAGGHQITRTLFHAAQVPPPPADFDMLVVMGGPMNIYEHDQYPWLAAEKKAIADAIAAGKSVIGICLGAQLIADVLGGRVTRNAQKEIGWFPVELAPGAVDSHLFRKFPKQFTAFHWHGDTFAIPPGATHVASSKACTNQAFEYDGRVVGLQFHLETSTESIRSLAGNCGDELVEGRFIQSEAEILGGESHVAEGNRLMEMLLEKMAGG
ncbi:MAG: type 1 glutamine amidotransferase [Nitrospirae bacterium]|nr:type 1 glutamine amidotransferase [Nitrospirota bacterium]